MITDEDVVRRWMPTGLLNLAKPTNYVRISRRLNEAAERALDGDDARSIEKEIARMRDEGLFDDQ